MIVLRLAGVIALWFAALLLWNLSAFRPRSLLSIGGLARLAGGAIFVFGALLLLYDSVPGLPQRDFSYLAVGSFLVALVADFMIGDDIRAIFRNR